MKRQGERKRWRLTLRTRKILWIAAILLVTLLVLGNGLLWAMYRQRTYPRTKVMGVAIGSVPYSNLAQKVHDMKLMPKRLILRHDTGKTEIGLADLGIQKDVGRSVSSASEQRSWLPMLNLLKSPELQAPVRFDAKQFNKTTAELSRRLRKDPINARLDLSGAAVSIKPEARGYELVQEQLLARVLATLDSGKSELTAPTKRTEPKVYPKDLQEAQKNLQNQLQTKITFRYNSKMRQAKPEEIAKWFILTGETYSLAAAPIQAYIAETGKTFGIRVKDIPGVAAAGQKAVSDQKPLDLTLTAQVAAKTITYCVAAKGVDASHLTALRGKLQSAFTDARGWSLDGLVEFKEASGCSFTVWLSAASLMPSFGPICDSMWSCRAGPNVVINFDRWQNASPSWNISGGSLDEYRYMVINHETGHWLGFGHAHCAGPGHPASVMQQQSIDLEGCAFNAWPTAAELASLRRNLGL